MQRNNTRDSPKSRSRHRPRARVMYVVSRLKRLEGTPGLEEVWRQENEISGEDRKRKVKRRKSGEESGEEFFRMSDVHAYVRPQQG